MTGCGAIAALTAAPTEPTKVVVSGGIGTGKTSALATVRSALRDAGVPVLSRPPRPGYATDAAVVVDDAHLLDDDDLRRLTELVGEPRTTVVIACQPLAHHATLTELTTAIARENPAVALGPLPGKDLLRAASEILGAVPPAELGRALMASTAGLPFLLYPAIEAARSAEGDAPVAAIHAARVALVERLVRVAEPVLDTLLLCSLSPELGPDDVAAALRVDSANAAALVDQARATGLISPSHNQTFVRSLHRSLTQLVGTARHHDVEASLLRSQQEMSTLSTDLALRLAEHGLRDSALADELATRAALGRGDPGQTARLYRAAADAGATTLTARLADALALTGDCATAGRLADDLLSSEDPAERATAVRIAASVAMHDGGAAQAADLFRWLGPQPDAHVAAASAIVSVATGDPSSARAALEQTRRDRPPRPPAPPAASPRACCSRSTGRTRRPWPGWASRSADQRPPGVAPDTAAALVTLAALHGGDPVRARSVIGRAVTGGRRRRGLLAHRHRLLLGWVRMQDGQLAAASADVTTTVGADLHRRDALWTAALQTAIARRSGDSGAVQKHWYTAMEVLAEYSIDLFSLLPLGELWVAAARLRQVDRLRLPSRRGVRAARVARQSAGVVGAAALGGCARRDPGQIAGGGGPARPGADRSRGPQPVRQGTGRRRPHVAAGAGQPGRRRRGHRRGAGLAQFGLTWDATRLAGQAALQTPDARVSGAMLQVARDLKLNVSNDDDPGRADVDLDCSAARTVQPPFARCPTGNARSPNCCCWACRTATSARSCSSRPRPSSITWRGSGAGSAPNRGRRCCRCCGRSWSEIGPAPNER